MADATIQIDRIDAETILVPIIGTSPLIVHRFSEKAKRQMLDAMQGRKTPKEAQEPGGRVRGGVLSAEGRRRLRIPSTAFKQATVGGARFYGKKLTMTALKQYLFFRGEPGEDGQSLVRLDGSRTCARTWCGSGAAGRTFATDPSSPSGVRHSQSSTSSRRSPATPSCR